MFDKTWLTLSHCRVSVRRSGTAFRNALPGRGKLDGYRRGAGIVLLSTLAIRAAASSHPRGCHRPTLDDLWTAENDQRRGRSVPTRRSRVTRKWGLQRLWPRGKLRGWRQSTKNQTPCLARGFVVQPSWRSNAMSLTNWPIAGTVNLRSEPLRAAPVASFDSPGRVPSSTSHNRDGNTLDILSTGSRVCLHGRPQSCGEVVRLIPMTGRVIVRLDPPHPSWRGTLRSFRLERLVICS